MAVFIYIIVGMSTSFLLTAALFIFYLRYRKGLLLQQYKMKEAEISYQKALLGAVITSQEKERSRIGMDLHDQVGATLSSLRLMVENFTGNRTADTTENQFGLQVQQRIDDIIDNVRHISHDLSPRIKGTYGFYDSLSDFCDAINSSGKIRVLLSFKDAAAETFLKDNAAMAVYRVIGELITNTIKHAQATEIGITFTLKPGKYTIDYSDNGIGFQNKTGPAEPGMGFRNIESRLNMIGAVYTFHSPVKGVAITISLPV